MASWNRTKIGFMQNCPNGLTKTGKTVMGKRMGEGHGLNSRINVEYHVRAGFQGCEKLAVSQLIQFARSTKFF
jgi:hypothetical protein